jgi:hypothetical protein
MRVAVESCNRDAGDESMTARVGACGSLSHQIPNHDWISRDQLATIYYNISTLISN